MKAAVVRSFDTPPRYEDFLEPVAKDRTELLVDVLAVGLHPRVRSQADGFALHEHWRPAVDPRG